MLKPYSFDEFIDCNEIYFLDSVNLNSVNDSIEIIKDDVIKYRNIIGIKIYLGYQKFYANDERVKTVVDFANANHLAVTFHCGEILDEDDKSVYSPYSNAKFIEKLLVEYPTTTFIASHMNWPNFECLFKMCNDYNNVYTCLSGTNDGETQVERKSQNILIAEIVNRYIKIYPNMKKKIMYGTDFFASSEEYNDVSSYKELINMLDLTENEREDVLCGNVKNAYKI